MKTKSQHFSCKTCFWFELEPGLDVMGRCHRYPPVLNSFDAVTWPGVTADDYCGEHMLKETWKWPEATIPSS